MIIYKNIKKTPTVMHKFNNFINITLFRKCYSYYKCFSALYHFALLMFFESYVYPVQYFCNVIYLYTFSQLIVSQVNIAKSNKNS